jgi:hypothetical protein
MRSVIGEDAEYASPHSKEVRTQRIVSTKMK